MYAKPSEKSTIEAPPELARLQGLRGPRLRVCGLTEHADCNTLFSIFKEFGIIHAKIIYDSGTNASMVRKALHLVA